MRALLLLLALPFLAYAQSSANSSITTAPSQTVTSTVLTTSTGRSTTATLTSVFTTVLSPSSPANSNSSSNSSSSTSTTTTPKNLPTAPSDVDGGGSGGAPLPGAKSPNGAFGPDDSYIAAATTLARNAMAVSLVGSAIAGALIIF